jgi:hypothetical protein
MFLIARIRHFREYGIGIILTLFVAIAFAKANAADNEVIEVGGPSWKGTIYLTDKQPIWKLGTLRLEVSPTTEGNVVYIPYDLSDAWRELDKMLPQSYQAVAADSSKEGGCLKNTSEEVGLLHNSLMSFLSEKWLNPSSSRFRAFFSLFLNFQMPNLSDAAKSRYDNDIAGLVTGVVLCNYYGWKASGTFPDIGPIVSTLKNEAARRKVKWTKWDKLNRELESR